VMLKKVGVNFLRTLAFYSIILMAFTLSFCTLLNKSEASAGNTTMSRSNETENQLSIFSALFHVILMLTGDFGTISDGGDNIIIGRIFLLIFVLSMTIVMMNLLVGLTVSDTGAIQNDAEWHKWWERAKLLGKYEAMALN
jgi:transient receptor potential cation channel subfamily A member 1